MLSPKRGYSTEEVTPVVVALENSVLAYWFVLPEGSIGGVRRHRKDDRRGRAGVLDIMHGCHRITAEGRGAPSVRWSTTTAHALPLSWWRRVITFIYGQHPTLSRSSTLEDLNTCIHPNKTDVR